MFVVLVVNVRSYVASYCSFESGRVCQQLGGGSKADGTNFVPQQDKLRHVGRRACFAEWVALECL